MFWPLNSSKPKAIGVDWPPVHHLDTFASCFNDALALRIQKEAEDEAFACALEAQQALGRGATGRCLRCHVKFSTFDWLVLVSCYNGLYYNIHIHIYIMLPIMNIITYCIV